jgi:hypothetical protein
VSDANPIDPRLAGIKNKIAANPEAVLTIQKPLADDASKLGDEDVEVLRIRLRVPSSALLEDISITKRGTDDAADDAHAHHDSGGVVFGDNDPTDGLSRKDVTDTI